MITIDKVRKSFGGDTAVADLSLTIQKGQVFGLVGTNGAGKSTLLRMTAGVLEPDSGSITIDEQQRGGHAPLHVHSLSAF